MGTTPEKVGSLRIIEGKYDVLAKLREGGMGALYLVRHRLLDELRIIKIMRQEVAQGSAQSKRFLREARTATRLRHANIVSFYDYFLDAQGTAFMVMEYIEGINLRDLLVQCGRMPLPLAMQFSREALAALEYLHRKGIVHRDISPDNIMVTREDGEFRVKLIDLGIAKVAEATEDLTRDDQFVGKLRYSSPEQLTRAKSSRPIDGRSDIFSFGVVLYEILTDVCPFRGDNFRDILTTRLLGASVPFDESDPKGKVPAELRAAIERSLKPEPNDRYQTASEFAQAISGISFQHEDTEVVDLYLRRTVQATMEAVVALHPHGSSVQDTLQSKFPLSNLSADKPGGEQPQFQSTELNPIVPETPTTREPVASSAAGLTIPIAASPAATMQVTVSEKTVMRRESLRRYSIAIVLAILVVGAGLAVRPLIFSQREPVAPARTDNSEKKGARETGTALRDGENSPSNAPDAPAQSPPPAAVPEPTVVALAQNQAPPGAAIEQRPAEARGAPDAETIAPTPIAPRKKPEKKAPRVIEQQSPATVGDPVVQAPRTKARYCSELEDTNFRQGVTREVPSGFQDGAARAPRPDSGLMHIRVSASPEHPIEGEPAFLSVKFENGGDNPVTVEQVQESLSRGGYRTVGNLSLPAIVNPGGLKELYQIPLTLDGEPWNKQFLIIDKRGDSWKAAFYLRPCSQ